MLAASCSQDADAPTQTDSRAEKLQVYFTLDLGEEGMSSRTTWENYDNNNTSPAQKGTDAENTVNDIQVLLFSNTDNAFLGEVSITAFYPTEGDSHLYKFYGELPTLPTGTSIMDTDKFLNCKLMVLANCSVDPSQITGTATIHNLLQAATFNFDATPDAIPMWGVLKVAPVTGSDDTKSGVKMREGGFPNPLPDIYLLRAMAKVEVIMKDSDHEITSIAVNRYNNTGHCIPTYYNAVTDTRLLVRSEAFNATSSVNTSSVSFFANESTTSGGYKCYTIYVPEYDNIGTGATPSSIDIQLDNNTNKTYRVFYGANGKTTDYNIVRNHIYRFNIEDVNDGFNISLAVQPWLLQEFNAEFTDNISFESYGWKEETIGNGGKPDAESNVLMLSTSDAVYRFKIQTPQNCGYSVSLSNTTDFEYSVVEEQDGIVQVRIKALETAESYPFTYLSVYAVTAEGKSKELDLTASGYTDTGTLNKRFKIIQNW